MHVCSALQMHACITGKALLTQCSKAVLVREIISKNDPPPRILWHSCTFVDYTQHWTQRKDFTFEEDFVCRRSEVVHQRQE